MREMELLVLGQEVVPGRALVQIVDIECNQVILDECVRSPEIPHPRDRLQASRVETAMLLEMLLP